MNSFLVLVVVALGSLSAVAEAQMQALRVAHRVACPTCKIAMDTVAILGKRSDPALLARMKTPARDSKGRFFAVGLNGERIVVFGPDGNYHTALGRIGDAPGEFGGLGAQHVLVGPGDSIYVADFLRRLSIFSPDLQFVRRITLPTPAPWLAILPSSEILVSGALRFVGPIPQPFHLLSSEGALLRSFGAIDPVVRPEGTRETRGRGFFFIASHDGRSLWSKTNCGYSFEQLDMSGRVERTIEVVDAPWEASRIMSPAVDVVSGRHRFVTPAGTAQACSVVAGVDTLDRAWITVSIPTDSIIPGGIPPNVSRQIIEVVDIRNGRVLVSHEFNGLLRLLAGGAYAALSNPADAFVSIAIVRLRVGNP